MGESKLHRKPSLTSIVLIEGKGTNITRFPRDMDIGGSTMVRRVNNGYHHCNHNRGKKD